MWPTEFQRLVLGALRRIEKRQEMTLATIADLDAALAAEDTELTSLGAAVASNTAILQKIANTPGVPEDLTTEVNKQIADNATLQTAIDTVTANDANPSGAATAPAEGAAPATS